MSWLTWTELRWGKALPWKREGCRLIEVPHPALGGEIILANAHHKSFPKENYRWKISSSRREGEVIDIPFWAVKHLVFERDDGVCQDCGGFGHETDREFHWNGPSTLKIGKPYTTKMWLSPEVPADFEVHHIIPVKQDGSNCTENLKLLCHFCHRRYNGKQKDDLSKYQKLEIFS